MSVLVCGCQEAYCRGRGRAEVWRGDKSTATHHNKPNDSANMQPTASETSETWSWKTKWQLSDCDIWIHKEKRRKKYLTQFILNVMMHGVRQTPFDFIGTRGTGVHWADPIKHRPADLTANRQTPVTVHTATTTQAGDEETLTMNITQCWSLWVPEIKYIKQRLKKCQLDYLVSSCKAPPQCTAGDLSVVGTMFCIL